jgi:iron-sulfur cluster assembly accessory protein
MEAITKDMTIGEVVRMHPSVAEVLLDAGVHCVGCGAAYYETIEQGLKGHGYSDKMVEEIVKQLNESVPAETATEDLVVTDNAAKKLKQVIEEHSKPGYGLKISVEPGGCSGFSYGMELVPEADPGDFEVEVQGVKFFVDAESRKLLKGAKVDYVDSLQGAGFKISNPNAKSTCGCGQSFS